MSLAGIDDLGRGLMTSGDAVEDSGSEDMVLPLMEEVARIGKRQVTTGKVRVTTVSDTIEEVAGATLQGEEVDIVRVPVDRVVSEAPVMRTEGEVTIVPILEEILVVEKQLVLKEELHIRRRATSEKVEVPVTLRKQRAVIERLDVDD